VSGFEIHIDGEPAEAPDGWELAWLDRARGIARLAAGGESRTVVVEGSGREWYVTLRGRRIPVTVETRRERLLAEAEVAAGHHSGPIDVRASLPGLVVAIQAEVGDELEEGAPLVTLQAMKMENEVRAPRAGTVVEVAVAAGQPVATGALLVRLA
jgi:pyruvate carboxylase